MIEVTLFRDSNGLPVRLKVSGHAERGPYGSDIVCAAASALVETLRIGFERVVHQTYHGAIQDGEADVTWSLPIGAEARALVETIGQALKDLAETEPDAVSFHEVGVP
ncbi:MAG: ribosomal-processing cysteine protease Prp [Firmicutes bacterium]|nr:ribosomal-processing cysteine protease Prp [Bacillota bacterium]